LLQLSGTPPFKGRRDREVLQAVRKGKYTLSGPRWVRHAQPLLPNRAVCARVAQLITSEQLPIH